MRWRDGVDGTDVRDDVALNCALARLSEVDDIHLAAMITPGAIVVPGALTIARSWPDADPAGLVAAIVAGYEAMVRLGLAINGPLFSIAASGPPISRRPSASRRSRHA